MISRERLKELIEQKAKIYSTHWQEEVDLSLPCKIVESEYDNKTITRLVVFEDEEHAPSYMIDNLTEDIEGAKWEEEFGCITRTERLEFPTWEMFLKINRTIGFISKEGKKIEIFRNDNTIFIEDEDWNILREPLTKENYTLACRKCKELFLGGSDGDIR